MADLSPAEAAAKTAQERMRQCLDEGQCFAIIAGAGAGKTHTLGIALTHLIDTRVTELLRQEQRIACITYTNVAADEIKDRVDDHPVLHCDTIHGFCWSLIKDFQPSLLAILPDLGGPWETIIEEAGNIGERTVVYDEGFRTISEDQISLHHDDVIAITVILIGYEKFRRLFATRYPIVFIDEYQDTNVAFAEALTTHLIGQEGMPLIGLFGDPWQKIYGDGCGEVTHANLKSIGLQSNFRSAPSIVNVLNRIRPDLTQEVSDPDAEGSVTVYHSNSWKGTRRTGAGGGHWKGDLPENEAKDYLERLKVHLEEQEGWDLAPEHTKILMLTHGVLAKEQGYANLLNAFKYKDEATGKRDPFIKFSVEILEPLCQAYAGQHYGKMFSIIDRKTPAIEKHSDKEDWSHDMDTLLKLRKTGLVKEVLAHLEETKRPRLPEKVESWLEELNKPDELWKVEDAMAPDEEAHDRLNKRKEKTDQLKGLLDIPYQEVVSFAAFLNDLTSYKTKHGVKGAQYENVLVVMGRGWNKYNNNKMLEMAGGDSSLDKSAFERARNLFYVVCSRPKKCLTLLFTEELSDKALSTLEDWFGADNVKSFE